MSFPGSIPTYLGFTSTHTLQQDSHASQHNLEQADIAALATKLGTGVSTPSNNTVLRGNGSGTSSYDSVHAATDISGVLGVGNGGTGVTSSTGTGSVVLGNSPTTQNQTLSGQPTISDFTNADHNHTNAATGGTLTITSAQTNSTIAQIIAGGNYKVQSGTVAVNATPDVAVTFAVAFVGTPVVVASTSSAGSANVFTAVNAITNSGFNIRQFNTAGSQTTSEAANWIAIGN